MNRTAASGHWGRVTATQNVCTAIGAAAGGVLAGVLGFRWSFLTGATCLLVAAAVAATIAAPRPSTPPKAAAVPGDDPAATLVDRTRLPAAAVVAGVVIALVHVGLGATSSFLAIYASRVHGMRPTTVGLLFSAYFLAMAGGAAVISRLSGTAALARLGHRRLLASALAVAATLSLLQPVLCPLLFAVDTALIGAVMMIVVIGLVSVTTTLLPARSLGGTIGTIESVSLGAGLLGPVLAGMIVDGRIGALFPTIGALYLGSLLLLLIFGRAVTPLPVRTAAPAPAAVVEPEV